MDERENKIEENNNNTSRSSTSTTTQHTAATMKSVLRWAVAASIYGLWVWKYCGCVLWLASLCVCARAFCVLYSILVWHARVWVWLCVTTYDGMDWNCASVSVIVVLAASLYCHSGMLMVCMLLIALLHQSEYNLPFIVVHSLIKLVSRLYRVYNSLQFHFIHTEISLSQSAP